MCYASEYSEDTVPIRFDRINEHGVFGQNPEDGIIVFIDRDVYSEVKQGDVWYCRLVYKGDSFRKFYFAWPMEKARQNEIKETVTTTTEKEIAFVAVGHNALYSEALRPGRYEAYRSPDGSRLQLIPSENGDIECRDSSVRIEGLDRFVGQVPRNLAYSRIDDRYLIKLED